MSSTPPTRERSTFGAPDKTGKPVFDWTLTSSTITDTVKLVAGPFNMLPVVFVPGIMGSNLKNKQSGDPVWRLDTSFGQPLTLASDMVFKTAGERQALLHPDKCEVDTGGHVPKKLIGTVSERATYTERGWGTVAQSSYHEFLLWLEERLNPAIRNPALWSDYYQDEATISAVPPPNSEPKMFPGVRMAIKGAPLTKDGKTHDFVISSDDLIKHSKFLMPVYAAGYNWLESNSVAAEKLQARIFEIIRQNNGGVYACKQVILVTHSMGGLVARACSQLPGMQDAIAGVVHGVMPATGAAVAYRRCKLGMSEEGYIPGLVIGSTGQDVTAVFAQAPGALQLLPAQIYNDNWLQVCDAKGAVLKSWPSNGDPYTDIYKVRDKWWGLVDEKWLSPRGGVPIKWRDFLININLAQDFHSTLGKSYHPTSYVFFGADDAKKTSFETITWKMKPGIAPDKQPRPTAETVLAMSSAQTRMSGTNPGYVGGETKFIPSYGPYGGGSTYESSFWELHCGLQDGPGDGTVPKSAGAAPQAHGGANVKAQFQISGIDHEGAFKAGASRTTTLYAITKVLSEAKVPA